MVGGPKHDDVLGPKHLLTNAITSKIDRRYGRLVGKKSRKYWKIGQELDNGQTRRIPEKNSILESLLTSRVTCTADQ
jgi:hypothetical protein